MLNLIKNEIFKIIKQKKLYIFMALVITMIALEYVGFLVLKNLNSNNEELNNSFAQINGQTFPLVMISEISTIIIIYIVALLADIITDEYKSGTLKLSLIRPVSRIKLLVSKVVGLVFGTVALYVFTLLMSYILGTVFFGWGEECIFTGFKYTLSGDLVTYTTTFSTLQGIFFTLGSYVLIILPYLAFGMLVLFISLLATNMGAAIGVSLGIWFGFQMLCQLVKQVRPYIINTYFNFFGQFANDPDPKSILTGFAVILAYGLVFFGLSSLVFKKKDILM